MSEIIRELTHIKPSELLDSEAILIFKDDYVQVDTCAKNDMVVINMKSEERDARIRAKAISEVVNIQDKSYAVVLEPTEDESFRKLTAMPLEEYRAKVIDEVKIEYKRMFNCGYTDCCTCDIYCRARDFMDKLEQLKEEKR